ncbi:helix-turn-helix transcriptional regulator [Nocardia sp. 2YAB30]
MRWLWLTGSALAGFLRSRRARVRPGDVGLPDGGGPRRVRGLRREELASLAGVSVDYYVRLEQGRCPNVSDAVLSAVATALRLDRAERDHLVRLARPPRSVTVPQDRLDVRAGVWQMLEWIAAPALVLGHRLDVLAWNRPAAGLIGDFGVLAPADRNLARRHLLDTEISRRSPDREFVSREFVAHLRVAAARYPGDTRLSALIDELRAHSAEFAREWEQHPVGTHSHGVKRFDHPVFGMLAMSYEITHLPPDSAQMLLIITAPAGSREEQILQQIATDTYLETTPAGTPVTPTRG